MKINNRLIQFAAGVFFLVACVLVWFSPHHSQILHQPSRLKVSAGTTNENTAAGYQVRKISLEISLFTNLF